MAAGSGDNFDGGVKLESRKKVKEPDLYRVILHNDNYTTMDFVVEVLMKVFRMPAAKATQVMLDVHKKGAGICGTYTYDIAVTKVEEVHLLAKEKQFPLKCTYERA